MMKSSWSATSWAKPTLLEKYWSNEPFVLGPDPCSAFWGLAIWKFLNISFLIFFSFSPRGSKAVKALLRTGGSSFTGGRGGGRGGTTALCCIPIIALGCIMGANWFGWKGLATGPVVDQVPPGAAVSGWPQTWGTAGGPKGEAPCWPQAGAGRPLNADGWGKGFGCPGTIPWGTAPWGGYIVGVWLHRDGAVPGVWGTEVGPRDNDPI